MDSNYPIVELQSASGLVYFAQTFNWSSTGVATGSTPVSTSFSLPASMPYGTYSLTVVANGIASAPVSFTGGIVGPSADLAVTNIGPSTSTEGNSVTYNLTVTNNGPTTATNVVLTDTLDANLKYVSATKSQGTVTHSGSVVTFSFGTVAVGQTVTATVTAQAHRRRQSDQHGLGHQQHFRCRYRATTRQSRPPPWPSRRSWSPLPRP